MLKRPFEVAHGEALELLRKAKENSVDALISDPPGGISFMGNAWDTPAKMNSGMSEREAFVAYLTPIFREALRVVKPGGFGLVWSLPKTSHWTAWALEDSGWLVKDCLLHLFGSGFPKNLSVDGPSGEKLGTALKPAFERWLLVKKPILGEAFDQEAEKVNGLVRKLLCLTLPAKFVGEISMSSGATSSEGMSSFAPWLVGVLHGVKNEGWSEVMGMSRSPGLVRTCLNIAWLWSSILGELWNPPSMSTISTVTELTIELRTFASYLSVTIQESTILEEIQTNGSPPGAVFAERLLSVAAERLHFILTRIAPVTAGVPVTSQSQMESRSQQGEIATSSGSLSNQTSVEYWWLVRKPTNLTYAENVLKWGVGALNIDASRVGRDPKDVPGWHKTGAKGSKGFHETDTFKIRDMSPEEIQGRCGSKGRFPSHLLLSHHEECRLVGESSVKSPNKVVQGGKSGGGYDVGSSNGTRHTEVPGYGDADGREVVEVWECIDSCPVRELDHQSGIRPGCKTPSKAKSESVYRPGAQTQQGQIYPDTGGASRFFYQAKPARGEKEQGLLGHISCIRCGDLHGKTHIDPETGNTQPCIRNNHATVKSVALMSYLIKLICPPGGLVLDPFLGSGTTGVACMEHGYQFVGIEQELRSYQIAKRRIEYALEKKGTS